MLAAKRKLADVASCSSANNDVPEWLHRLLANQQGDINTVRFVMEKNIFRSDLDMQQNRLLFPRRYVESNLLPELSHDETIIASFNNNINANNAGNEHEAQPNGLELAIVPFNNNNDDDGHEEGELVGAGHGLVLANIIVPVNNNEGEEVGAMVPFEEQAKKERKKMEVGRRHGELPVSLYTKGQWRFELLLTRWDKSGGTVLKGCEWKYVIVWASLKVNQVVQVWSFRKDDGKLCFAIANKDNVEPSKRPRRL